MKKFLVKLGLILLVLLVGLFLARNFIARQSVQIGVKTMTGFPLEIDRVNLGVLGGTLSVENLKLMNPPEFKGSLFVDLPLFQVDYETLSLFSGTPHIRKVVVNVKEVVLVKNEHGVSNATVFQNKVSPPTEAKPTTEPAPPASKQAYRVDLVRVHIGTVVIKDYSKGPTPSVKTMKLNQEVVVKDLTENTSITALVMRTMLGPIGSVAGDLVTDVGSTAKQAGETLQKTGKGLFDTLKKAVPQK